MRLAKKSLQALTNKFIQEFCDLAHAEAVKEKESSKHPQLISDKRNDSYAFNCTLAECLAYSPMGQKSTTGDYPLIGMGFVDNVAKSFFKNSIRGFHKNILFILNNHTKQYKYDDYSISNVQEKTWQATKDEINTDSFFDKSQPTLKPVTKDYKDISFDIKNSKNSYEGKAVVSFIDGEIEQIAAYCGGKLQLTIDFDKRFRMGGKDKQDLITILTERPTLHHYKYIADINSFFIVLDNVYMGIKENMKKKAKNK